MSRKQVTAVFTEGNIFAIRFREILNRRGETPTSLAKRIKEGYESHSFNTSITQQSLQSYCSGQSTPKTEVLTTLCEALNVSADYLLGLQESENPVENLHPLLEKYKRLFDMLFAAEDNPTAKEYNINLLERIAFYVLFEKSDKLIVYGNNGYLDIADNEADANEKTFGIIDDMDAYENADDFFKYVSSKRIMEALDNLRDYIATHD